jgi:2'-5' RNA ligase
MRLFVGIPLPEDIREALTRLAAGVPGARWIWPENYHLTLRFIGEVDGPEIDDVAEALAAVAAPPLDLQLDGVGYFGDRRRPKVLWAGVVANPDLDHLQKRVERRVCEAGVAPETRKYHPHVTLARLRGAPFKRVGGFLEMNGAFQTRSFAADKFVLFESRLGNQGSAYIPQVDYPLTTPMGAL